MPNIKPELRSGVRNFIETRQGETLLVMTVGAVFWYLFSFLAGRLAVFVSETLYPFTYAFFHTPLHAYLPEIVTETKFAAELIFGALFSAAIYTFEKNIFYRRFRLPIKAIFASVAACTFVYLSGAFLLLLERAGFFGASLFLLGADAGELPALLLYYGIASLPVFYLCDTVRRRIFKLP